MKTLRQTFSHAFAIGSLLTGLFTASAWAQSQETRATESGRREITTRADSDQSRTTREQPHSPTVEIDPALIKVNKREPIPFVPFAMRHPSTGEEIAPDTILKLANGKEVVAREYFDELNRLEEQFNALGYSLRDGLRSATGESNEANPASGKAAKPPLQESETDMSQLQGQVRTLEAMHMKLPPGMEPLLTEMTPENEDALQRFEAAQEQREQARLRAIAASISPVSARPGVEAATPAVYSNREQININLGDPKLLAAYVKGYLDLNLTSQASVATGEARVGGTILGSSQDLVKVKASVNAPGSKPMRAYATLDIMGTRVYTFDETKATSWTKSQNYSKSFDKQVLKTRFMVGPIPMSASFGVRGNGGVSYSMTIRPAYARLNFEPYVNSAVYAQAGVDVVVAEAGVRGSVTLLNDKLSLSASAGLYADAQKRLYYEARWSGINTITALKGKVDLYAKVDLLFYSDEWTYTIFNWNGPSTRGTLFDKNFKKYLY